MIGRKEYIEFGLLGAGIAAAAVIISSRPSIPKGARAVKCLDKTKYLGRWYEIARLDHRFEKGLDYVTAEYSAADADSIRVDNKGYDRQKGEWKESVGKAKAVGKGDDGRLKVSFFGPFYSAYNVIAIDADYRYALVAGNNLDYLWLLSREKTMPLSIRDRYLRQAGRLGYDTDKLIWTKQD